MSSFPMPSFIRNLQRKFSKRMFADGDELFMTQVSGSKIYGQYGFNKAILWVLNNHDNPAYMVDTSQHWIAFYREQADIKAQFHPCWVDVGEIGHFGQPVNYEKQKNFHIYTDWLWQQKEKPDLVMITGRFRVCCFLTTMKHAAPGTKIIFNDYFNRPAYHFVEDFSQPVADCGRQALFEVPQKGQLDLEMLDKRIAQFRMVTD